MLGVIVIAGLIIVLLPVLLLLYIFTPKRSTQSWFNTFSQQARGWKQQKNNDSDYNSKIPASEDIIDVSADEIENKK
jgi:hypothetical protein